MACSCGGGTKFIVTTGQGVAILVNTETEAMSLATSTSGSYRAQ